MTPFRRPCLVTALADVVRHLIHYGPARNDAEREQLLASLDDDGKDKDSDSAAKRTGRISIDRPA